MAPAVLHCKSDSVNCSTVYHIICSVGHRETTHNGRCLSYITWSSSRWSMPDQAAITNGSQPTSPPQAMPAASVQRPTQKTTTIT